jgi:ribosomal protein S18 acetylase RimI-like enzyme
MAREGERVFVAEVGGRIAGYAAVRIADVPDTPVHAPGRRAEVDTVVVGAAFRRRGVGEALMERAHAWAAEQGVGEVELLVAEFNAAAIALYEKLGYATVYRRMFRPLPAGARDDGADRP